MMASGKPRSKKRSKKGLSLSIVWPKAHPRIQLAGNQSHSKTQNHDHTQARTLTALRGRVFDHADDAWMHVTASSVKAPLNTGTNSSAPVMIILFLD